MKIAIFSCMGLGDGLISLVLSNNLACAGHEVDTYHPFMKQMQPLFPDLPIKDRPKDTNFIKNYSKLIFIYEKSPWMLHLLNEAKSNYPKKMTILNPIATPNTNYPYWEEGRFNGNHPFVENLVNYCKNILNLPSTTKENGIQLHPDVKPKKYPNRVILHPTSSRLGKNWTPAKFIRLSKELKKEGFEPVFILTEKEKIDWQNINAPSFENLIELTYFIAESGFMIGNDSGIGHLASCVGIPTLTICRTKLAANFWRPTWAKGKTVVPPPLDSKSQRNALAR